MSTAVLQHHSAVEHLHGRGRAIIRAILLALLGLCLSGAVLAAQAPTSNSSSPRPDSLTNESLLNLLARSNRAMIAEARAAEARVQNADVKRFAGQMATEHSAMLASLQQMRGQLGYAAPDSNGTPPAANGIVGNDTTPTAPNGVSDWSYVDQEIAGHTSLLLALQQQVSKVGDQRLRAFVANVMQTEETHLRNARELLTRQPKPESPETGASVP